MFQNVTLYSTIVFFILSYNLYLILIKIFKILKTRILLNKVYEMDILEMKEYVEANQITSKFNLLVKEITEYQSNA